jgi:hypothetical protein
VTPLGYLVERAQGGRGPGRLVPDPAWGALVARTFRMALSGQGACSIAATFNEEGLLTHRGRRWSKQAILYILRNEVYTGVYIWGVSQNGKFANTPMEKLRVEGAHEALVSADDYARVQAAIEIRRPDVTHPRTSAGEYLLSGLLMCSYCGGPYIGHGARNGTYHYYTCQTKMKQGVGACPEARNFERTKVEGVVVDVLRAGALHPAVFGDLIREVQASLGAKQSRAKDERLVLHGQIAEVDRRLTKLYEAVESGSIPFSRLAPRIEQVSGEKDELERRIGELPSGEVEPLLLIGDEDIESWVTDLRTTVDRGTVDERRALLRSWVKRVVATGDELTVEYTFPLVSVGGPDGASGSGGGPDGGGRGAKVPGTRVPVNSRRRDGSGETDKNKKGETAVRRFLPTVRYGSRIGALREPGEGSLADCSNRGAGADWRWTRCFESGGGTAVKWMSMLRAGRTGATIQTARQRSPSSGDAGPFGPGSWFSGRNNTGLVLYQLFDQVQHVGGQGVCQTPGVDHTHDGPGIFRRRFAERATAPTRHSSSLGWWRVTAARLTQVRTAKATGGREEWAGPLGTELDDLS